MLHPLAQHFRVIAPDLPGHGFTKGRPPNGLTMPGVARALAGLIGELVADPALVVGHSAGAAIAIRMALDGLAADFDDGVERIRAVRGQAGPLPSYRRWGAAFVEKAARLERAAAAPQAAP
jgi:pimeloyl-ACP methyl ester carboxylesterase